MSKAVGTKPRPPPWIPPGKGMTQYKKHTKTKQITKDKIDPAQPKVPLQWETVDILKETANENVDIDVMSISSHSSYELGKWSPEIIQDIHYAYQLQEMKLLYTHFASIKISYISSHRLIDSQYIDDSNVKKLLIEAEVCMKALIELFDDHEYLTSVWENTLNENQKKEEYSKVLKNKEKLLSRLLMMHDKVILIFQVIFEKQDFKELSQLQESLSQKLNVAEKKCISQEAVITDLERRLSICQSKTSAMESYNTNLENDKAELEKQLLYKEARIKYLNNELMNASERQTKSDHDDFIAIIEDIKSRAHTEKSALKKALRFQKTQSEKKEEMYEKLLTEINEKAKMMFDIAAQRDQLKIHLTVLNNSIIQHKNQIEEIKIQNLKLQNEMTEKDLLHKKEITQLKDTIEEKSSELNELLKTKTKLQKTIEELENELRTKEYFKGDNEEVDIPVNLYKSKESNGINKEIHHLTSLLQSMRERFEILKPSLQDISAAGDSIPNGSKFANVQNEILAAVKDIQKDFPKKTDLEKQLKKMEHLYNSSLKENEALKQEVKDLTSSHSATSAIQNTKNNNSTNISDHNSEKNLQLELCRKDREIATLQYELKQRERDLENQQKESKEKLRTLESDNSKMLSLEEELKSTKIELAVLEKRKEDEIERLLQRTKELQDSLDKKTSECANLEYHNQHLRTSYFRVFGDS